MKNETFYFRSQNHFDTVSVVNSDTCKQVTYTDKDLNSTVIVDFGTFGNASTKSNVSALRKLGLALLRITRENDESLTSKVANKIKVRINSYKYLKDFLSNLELCYVKFADGTCAVIGEYIDALLGEDCILFSDQLDFEEVTYFYNLDGYGISTAVSKYFKANSNKEVTECHIVSDQKLFEFVKERIQKVK